MAGAAHAGTVTTLTFGNCAPDVVVVANGVEARSTSGFVVYRHGAWSPAVAPPDTAVAVAAKPVVANPAPLPVSSCVSQEPIVHRGLASSTSAGRRTYWPLIRDAECRHALPSGLLDAVVLQESRYRPFAISPVGAGGLTQLMPRTAAGLGVADRFEPLANIDGGARYLRSMLDHYRSVPLALAAYNAGRRSVDRWGGIPLNRETPGYVQKVLGFFNDHGPIGTAFPGSVPVAVARAVSLSFADGNY